MRTTKQTAATPKPSLAMPPAIFSNCCCRGVSPGSLWHMAMVFPHSLLTPTASTSTLPHPSVTCSMSAAQPIYSEWGQVCGKPAEYYSCKCAWDRTQLMPGTVVMPYSAGMTCHCACCSILGLVPRGLNSVFSGWTEIPDGMGRLEQSAVRPEPYQCSCLVAVFAMNTSLNNTRQSLTQAVLCVCWYGVLVWLRGNAHDSPSGCECSTIECAQIELLRVSVAYLSSRSDPRVL